MSFQLWLAFVAASSILLIIPGPTIITVIAYATAHGKKATLPLVTAVALGDASAITLSMLGLGGLLATSSATFTLIKTIGGVYLLYLGISMLLSEFKTQNSIKKASKNKRTKLFFNTWLVTALNPKGIIFFIAFLPQFIQTKHAITPQLWILAITFVSLAALNTVAYALLATRANKLLTSKNAKRGLNFGGGLTITTAGLWALTAKQQ